MPSRTPNQIDLLVRFSRRQLWFVLVFLLVFGIAHMTDLLFPAHSPVLVSLPVFLVLCLAVQLRKKGEDFSSSSPAMKALRNDELRQLAQAKAFRNGFFALLAYPPICALALTGLSLPDPLPAVVASGAWIGAVVFLASLLWYDR